MTASDLSDDVFRSRLQTVVAGMRYWIPSVADAARVEETETNEYWKITVTPRVAGACPLEMKLRADRRLDIRIGGETFKDLEMMPFEDFLPLADAVSEGRVRQRSWISPATGTVRDVETEVTFANGKVWCKSRSGSGRDDANKERDTAERRDRHFLPYRRT